MRKIIYIFSFLLTGIFFTININAQTQDEDIELSNLINIYSNLEYNTIAFDDLKNKWIISDPLLVREVFNRFVVHNALRLKGKPLTHNEIRMKSLEIQGGNTLIFLRKRYYDDEIEYFAFLPYSELYKQNPQLLVDSVDDGFYLRSIIGQRLYKKLQERSYFFSGVTKDVFDVRAGYYFDIYLNLIEPHLMFWSTTSKERNKYLLSVFGQWGNDNIFMPGQFLRTYTVGTKLTYYDVISSEPGDYSYEVSVGIGLPSNNMYVSALPKTANLLKSGQDIYIKLSGQPFETLFPKFENFYMDVELGYNVIDYNFKDYGINRQYDFYSFKDYFSIKVRKRKIFNVFNLGQFKASLGVSTHDIYRLRIDPTISDVIDLEPNKDFMNKFVHYVIGSVGIEKFGGLIQYDVDINFGYSMEGYMLGGVKALFMLSDNFGLDLRYYQTLGFSKTEQPWRTDTYLVFSPVLKINY